MISAPTPENLRRAAQIINDGGLVGFPTETVYGLGADGFNTSAVEKIYRAKQRPSTNPLILHLSSIEQLESVALLQSGSALGRRLTRIQHLFPGPLTVILPKSSAVPPIVTAGQDSVGIRIPDHPVAQALIEASGTAIAAPSANVSAYVSPTTAEHVEEGFGDAIEMILDGGPCSLGLESTILSLVGSEPKILRYGAVSAETLSDALGVTVSTLIKQVEDSKPIRSPGQFKEHYSPSTPMRLRDEVQPSSYPSKVGLISFYDNSTVSDASRYTTIRNLSDSGDLDEVAKHLYRAVRELDGLGLELIVIDTCEERGIGRAVMDRLRKATARFS